MMGTSPKTQLSRSQSAAMLVGAIAVAAAPLAHPAVASAQKVLDVETYDNCVQDVKDSLAKGTIHLWDVHNAYVTCCEYSGGTWNESSGECQAPPGDSPRFPGSGRIPTDIATAPVVTQDSPRVHQVPTDVATVPTGSAVS